MGTFVLASDRSTYAGEMSDGKRHGRGIITLANGWAYDGQWENDHRTGKDGVVFNTRTEIPALITPTSIDEDCNGLHSERSFSPVSPRIAPRSTSNLFQQSAYNDTLNPSPAKPSELQPNDDYIETYDSDEEGNDERYSYESINAFHTSPFDEYYSQPPNESTSYQLSSINVDDTIETAESSSDDIILPQQCYDNAASNHSASSSTSAEITTQRTAGIADTVQSILQDVSLTNTLVLLVTSNDEALLEETQIFDSVTR